MKTKQKPKIEIFHVVREINDQVGEAKITGSVLNILGKEFKALSYDWYIYDAIALVEKWDPEQITYDRIMHLRTWIRENYQHGHNFNYSHVRSMGGAKKFIDEVIRSEYRAYDEEDMWKEQREFSLKHNKEIFSPEQNNSSL